MVKLVQLGLGVWGRSWVDEVTSRTPGIEPVAWVDRDPKSARRRSPRSACRAIGCSRRWSRCRPSSRPTAALVVVPLAAHAAATRAALEPGSTCWSKSRSRRPWPRPRHWWRRLAAARDRKLMVSQNYRWFPAPRLARRLVPTGHRHGDGVLCRLPFSVGPDYRYFFLDEPLLSDMAIHHFDTMRYVLDDEPVEVSCQSWNEPASPFQGRPAAIVATAGSAAATVVSYRGSWISRGPTTPYGGEWRLDGTRGAIELRYRGAGASPRELGPCCACYGSDGAAGRCGPARPCR